MDIEQAVELATTRMPALAPPDASPWTEDSATRARPLTSLDLGGYAGIAPPPWQAYDV